MSAPTMKRKREKCGQDKEVEKVVWGHRIKNTRFCGRDLPCHHMDSIDRVFFLFSLY
jgi:hypothetical protein